MAKRLSGSIELTKLPQSVIINKKNKAGEIVRCLILPIEGNNLNEYVDKEGNETGRIFMDIGVVIREEKDDYGQNGFVAKNVDSETYKAIKDNPEELKKLQPILGNLKDWSKHSEQVEQVETIDDDEDLPF